MIKIMSALRLKNTSESDPHSYTPAEPFLGFICNCLSYFITVRITFTCINLNVEKAKVCIAVVKPCLFVVFYTVHIKFKF